TRFSTGETLQTEPRRVGLNEWVHLAVTRGSIHVNGRPSAQGAVREGDLDPPKAPFRFGRGSEDGKFFCGLIDEVRLYDKALDAAGILRLAGEGLPSVLPKAHAGTPFGNAFSLERDDVVVFAGGENVLAAQESGHLEADLSSSAAGKRVLFRTLSWEGDTVHEQPRPLNFGSWRDQLARVGASVIFAQYGQVEALEGKSGLERFTAAYDRLLGEFTVATRRIVVVSPFPYERPGAPRPDLSTRNDDLRLYVESIRAIAAKRGLLFVDLFEARFDGPVTRDGLHLSAAGHESVAREIARRLGLASKDGLDPLREAIRRKNRLWVDYWRPHNWAFLNGDRIEQPSSRDHADKRVRWFPVEVQQTLALLRREESAIGKLLGEKR
ncbi:MAG TPA: LamG-like jellyroll fold domain-containing protein, partial [Planctomycetota bacterium]|nr:LamG-like jellyroll fold domain-containing protein [Planctomycetota bacterium]